MITISDAEGTLLETKITVSMQCLESIKTYFAISEGRRHGIREEKNGRFGGNDVTFEGLLRLTLQDVGMTLPKAFPTIVRLRNALIHRGFIRETDSVTRFIFGPLNPGTVNTAMFETMEQVQDLLREFVLRLLHYKGSFLMYTDAGANSKTLI